MRRIDDLETNDLLKLIFISVQDLVAIEQADVRTGETLQMSVAVTDEPAMVNETYVLEDGSKWYGPWIQADIFNDGPAPAYFSFNQFERKLLAPLNPGDMFVEDRKQRKLTGVALYCKPGQTASVRVFWKR